MARRLNTSGLGARPNHGSDEVMRKLSSIALIGVAIILGTVSFGFAAPHGGGSFHGVGGGSRSGGGFHGSGFRGGAPAVRGGAPAFPAPRPGFPRTPLFPP